MVFLVSCFIDSQKSAEMAKSLNVTERAHSLIKASRLVLRPHHHRKPTPHVSWTRSCADMARNLENHCPADGLAGIRTNFYGDVGLGALLSGISWGTKKLCAMSVCLEIQNTT